MIILVTYFSAFLGLLLAVFKDYLKVNRAWIRKQEQAVADSISISALLIGMANSLPYLLLVAFVYHDWLVTIRTLSDNFRAFITLFIGIGVWFPGNRGIPIWRLLLRGLHFGKQESLYEIILVPQDEHQITHVKKHYPELALVPRRGGQVFVVDQCDSLKKAKTLGKNYQDLGLYTTCIRAGQTAQ